MKHRITAVVQLDVEAPDEREGLNRFANAMPAGARVLRFERTAPDHHLEVPEEARAFTSPPMVCSKCAHRWFVRAGYTGAASGEAWSCPRCGSTSVHEQER